MEVEIVSTQTIRPAAAAGASPTPAAAERCFSLSIFDQSMPAVYLPIILFYSAGTDSLHISAKSDILKKSLSKTLTHFFPLAGKISDNIRIADEGTAGAGIEYTEARVKGKLLHDILSPPNMEAVGQLLPAVNPSLSTERLLVVRQSVFECGGMAIGICFAHKVVDAAAIGSFLRSWSATARGGAGSSSEYDTDHIILASRRFPPSDSFATFTFPAYKELIEFTSRRFVLSGSQVASLKAKSCSQSVAHPTRLEAVISLIWKCAIRSCKTKTNNNPSNSSTNSSGAVWQFVNLRNRVDPPLPDNTFGNLIGYYKASAEQEEKTELASLVSKLRQAKEEYMRVYPKRLNEVRDRSNAVCESSKEILTDMFSQNGDNNYFFSSVCKLDLYGAGDFGWGKPIWATFYINLINYVVLSDTSDEEGIQVWLSLPKHQMDVFEKDPLLLSYATPNPSIYGFDQTTPRRLFRPFTNNNARVSSSHYYCPSSSSRLLIMLSRPNSLSQLLLRTAARPRHYSPRPSIRFISSLLQFHRKLIR